MSLQEIAVRRVGVEPLIVGHAKTLAWAESIPGCETARVPTAKARTAITWSATVSWSADTWPSNTRPTKTWPAKPPSAEPEASETACPEADLWKRLVLATGDCRAAPGVVEPFPLGVHPAPAIAVALHAVVRVSRTVRASQGRPRAAVSAGHQPCVRQRLNRRFHRILGDAHP